MCVCLCVCVCESVCGVRAFESFEKGLDFGWLNLVTVRDDRGDEKMSV